MVRERVGGQRSTAVPNHRLANAQNHDRRFTYRGTKSSGGFAPWSQKARVAKSNWSVAKFNSHVFRVKLFVCNMLHYKTPRI